MMESISPNGPRVQAAVVGVGLMTFVCGGMAACFALVAVVFFLVVQFILLVLQSVIEAFAVMHTTWVDADPFIRLVILAALVFGAYKVYQWRLKRGK